MRCSRIRRCLSEYIDGALDVRTAAMIAEHLAVCAQCCSLCDTLEKTLFLARSWYCEECEPPGWIVRRAYCAVRVHYKAARPGTARRRRKTR